MGQAAGASEVQVEERQQRGAATAATGRPPDFTRPGIGRGGRSSRFVAGRWRPPTAPGAARAAGLGLARPGRPRSRDLALEPVPRETAVSPSVFAGTPRPRRWSPSAAGHAAVRSRRPRLPGRPRARSVSTQIFRAIYRARGYNMYRSMLHLTRVRRSPTIGSSRPSAGRAGDRVQGRGPAAEPTCRHQGPPPRARGQRDGAPPLRARGLPLLRPRQPAHPGRSTTWARRTASTTSCCSTSRARPSSSSWPAGPSSRFRRSRSRSRSPTPSRWPTPAASCTAT